MSFIDPRSASHNQVLQPSTQQIFFRFQYFFIFRARFQFLKFFIYRFQFFLISERDFMATTIGELSGEQVQTGHFGAD
jgi:hypothetical protein